MASANFLAFDRTLRRLHMMQLVETMAQQQGTSFRASLVVNARTGRPIGSDIGIASSSLPQSSDRSDPVCSP